MIVPSFIELAEPDPSLYQLIARAKNRHAESGSAKQFFQHQIYARAEGNKAAVQKIVTIYNHPIIFHGKARQLPGLIFGSISGVRGAINQEQGRVRQG